MIIRWLAQNAKRLGNGNSRPLIDPTAPAPADHRPLDNPTDANLVEACQQWLAVTGTPDQRIEEFAQPNESPNTTSRPLPFSTFANDVARNALQAAGLNSPSLPLN